MTTTAKPMIINIIKKNRKYFAITVNNYPAKLVIDDYSDQLKPGEQELLLEDISVRTKFGTELIYKMAATPAAIESAPKLVTLQHRYNIWLVKACRDLGGRFDDGSKTWVFSGLVADKVEDLDARWNSPEVAVEITAPDDGISAHTDPVCFCGYVVARAFGRDSGAKLGEGVSLLEGSIGSGGSMKNWHTRVRGGSKLRLYVPREILKDNREAMEARGWEIKELVGDDNAAK